MAKIKRLILGIIPNHHCNLKCEYCYISQIDAWDKPIIKMDYTAEHIAKCLSVKRLGGVCMINLTGYGETLLQHEVVELVNALLKEGHYIEIVTNGTVSKHIYEILQFPVDMLKRLEFKISFHYAELVRLNMLDRFFETIEDIHSSGASFTLELMANDSLEEDIEEIKKLCNEKLGAVCIGTIGRDDSRKDKGLLSRHSKSKFREVWGTLESKMLDFKLDVLGVKRKEFCYAGDWSLFVNMFTGETRQCYEMPDNQNIFKNPERKIKFVAVGHKCKMPYCMNAHAHLAWGLIPELKTPTYCEMRNRVCVDGKQWINSECREFFSSKLVESNCEYSGLKKIENSLLYPIRWCNSLLRHPIGNLKKIEKYLKRR